MSSQAPGFNISLSSTPLPLICFSRSHRHKFMSLLALSHYSGLPWPPPLGLPLGTNIAHNQSLKCKRAHFQSPAYNSLKWYFLIRESLKVLLRCTSQNNVAPGLDPSLNPHHAHHFALYGPIVLNHLEVPKRYHYVARFCHLIQFFKNVFISFF